MDVGMSKSKRRGKDVNEGTVDNVEQMAAACARLGEIRGEDCRIWVERKYSVGTMADAYEALMGCLIRIDKTSNKV